MKLSNANDSRNWKKRQKVPLLKNCGLQAFVRHGKFPLTSNLGLGVVCGLFGAMQSAERPWCFHPEPERRAFLRSIVVIIFLIALLFAADSVLGNIPGGGTGTGVNVTVTDNGDGTVTMGNGVLSIHVIKSGASIDQFNYTYNNGGGTQTRKLLAGGKNGGQLYWQFGGWGGGWAYSLVTNSGGYAEIDLLSDSASNGVVDIHYSMLRGSPGFYVTAIFSHRAQDAAMGMNDVPDGHLF